ncbi:RagB/SusD family nutrient uptake outer membrane protein [Flavobacterium sp. UMI-01]|uniref:RagB/SusD family nutrient uptake outer membrane protein n=1 Tax=Flavobacterium sp. UMI-01 TaxID=1441053 RepID=UPI001C7E15CB|nr:RagB/SusD family nutrient uptake outer membrane protein [Flavobacterium sp. UMI-01]GIZ08883.1 hypothetical protein FUMI01_16100 [Flavobacterium sp. UMI-01]
MKKYIYKCISGFLILGLLSSCNPDLTENNPNYTDSSQFWKNLNDTNSGLTAAYATLLSPYIFNLREEMVRSDMGWYSNVRPVPFLTGDLAYTFWFQNYTNNNQFIDRHWAACYRGIFRTNQVIEALERIKSTTTDMDKWTYQMAQARFLRGLYHFYLHTSFNKGKIIIEDHTPVTPDDFFKSVSSSEDVLKFFRADLQYAYENLPATKPAEKGRATKAAAATVLGTSYLYEGEHALAEPYFANVISNTNYSLFGTAGSGKDPITLFYTANEFNSESIFEVNFDGAFRPELGNFDEESTTNRLAFVSFSQNLCFTAPAWVAYSYKSEPMDALDARNHVGGVITNPLRAVPLRASAMVTLPEDLHTPAYGVPAVIDASAGLTFGAVNATAQPRVFAYYKKYLNVDLFTAESANPLGAQKSSKNFIVHRLSEVYLMQAECLIKRGAINEALTLINKVRARWGLVLYGSPAEFAGTRTYDGVVYNATTLMNKIMYVDKPLETSAEGHATRFTDLRRWGILKSNFVALSATTYYTNDFKYAKTVNPNIGTQVTRFKTSVVNEANKVSTSLPIPNEFTIPAQNFVEGTHEYLPLPSNEVGRNPNLSK